MRGRFLTALAWIAVALLFSYFTREVPRFEAERRPLPDAGQPPDPAEGFRELPAPSRLDPEFRVEGKPCPGTCTGTAFSLDRDGLWMTARHVVDPCRGIVLLAREPVAVTGLFLHPSADVALLRTAGGGPEVGLADGALRIGQDGFAFGYPAGRPGEVHGQVIGRVRVREAGGGSAAPAPGIAWAELVRHPPSLPQLSGLSGSPMLDARGAVVGVVTAESSRRGRVITAAPDSLREAIRDAGVMLESPAGRVPAGAISPDRLTRAGDELRGRLTVAKVACQGAGPVGRRPPPSY